MLLWKDVEERQFFVENKFLNMALYSCYIRISRRSEPRMAICRICITFLSITVLLEVSCYEKTLRKIVRNQSKMVQKPFSEDYGKEISWKNISMLQHTEVSDALTFQGRPGQGHTQSKTVIHKLQRPKISTIISAVDTGRTKSAFSKMKTGQHENMFPAEMRLARGALGNITAALQTHAEGLFRERKKQEITNNSYPIAIDNYYEIPTHSRYFPPLDEHGLQNVEQRSSNELRSASSNENSIVIPDMREMAKDKSSNKFVKGIFIANSPLNVRSTSTSSPQEQAESEIDASDKDFLIQETGILTQTGVSNFTNTWTQYSCTANIKETKGDIDAQQKFSQFNIEPPWMLKKHFWNNIFDSRYESLMRSPIWPPLKVILIPRTHVDTIWKRTFESYHNDTAKKILSNIVKKLHFYSNLTFSWNEVSHLSHWWKSTSARSRALFRRLVREGRLEITTGGWVEPDEATTHMFGLVHLLIEGHQWLKHHLNFTPKVGWLSNSVTHSPTMVYLLSAAEISNFVTTNLHYSWEEYLAEYQYSDFVWIQNWSNDKSAPSLLNEALNKIGNDRLPKHSVLTHYLQFNSAGFRACGPSKTICTTDFNFGKLDKNQDVYSYNVKEKSELLLEQYSKTGTTTLHNVIMAPVGDPYRYESQADFDYQYNNYHKLADFVNVNRDIYKATIEFGTAHDYFKTVFENRKTFPTLTGDFVNFADLNNGSPAYWVGFFTSRPLLKILLRRLQSTLRSTEILFSFALGLNAFRDFNLSEIFHLLINVRETTARLLDRNVVSGTLSANALKYVHTLILTTVKHCWYIQEVAASLLSIKPELNTPYLQKYVYRDGEFISVFRTVDPGDQIYIFNSLSQERTEVIELIVRNPNIRIIDHNKKEVTIQINPVWKYTSDNFIKISRRYFKVIFAIIVPPLTLELYKIKGTYDATQSAAAIYCLMCVVDELASNGSIFPFSIHPIETGDIQLESYKHRLIFDELTGLLKTVVEKSTNIEKPVVIDYGAFRCSDINSGMFLFNTNVTKPLHDILMPYRMGTKSKVVMIASGQVGTELTAIYGKLLQNTIKIYNLVNSPVSDAIYIESKVDYEVSPKNRELELFLSIQSDISNGNSPKIYTDNNGFQYTARTLNMSRRIESNMYPMTSMAYIQDLKSRLTIITDHAQGVTALQEGHLVVMLDRRVLYNDGRGTNEGLADSSATCHRHYILLENFVEPLTHQYTNSHLQLPSLSAMYLANSLNYLLDIFIILPNQADLCYYAFLPLIKTSFPCDVSVVNYRVIINRGSLYRNSHTALLILHRQTSSCQIDHAVHHCNGEADFSLDKILNNVKAIYQTNLAGTNKGIPIHTYNLINFPPMELMSLRLHF